ncbi:unnamed protein product [Microthlaspi erraticum]|uniref:Uncharacterized protein n=1 Tax=Microthlaspi erraticum TaxID=1685480 RepID=A0A6D2I9G4_9BRAS|nr:unnamed protein product [Microthlaspi erraticum]
MACSAGLIYARQKPFAHARTGKERPRSAEIFVSERTDRAGRSGKQRSASAEIARPRQNPSAIGPNFSRPRYTMAKTKGNESMKKKKNPFMEPPKKQIKLGSSSSNARAAIPTSPHSIDAIKNMWRVQEEEKMIGHL